MKGSEFMYRDMGGANVLLNENELQSMGLPNNLVSSQYFYWDTFYVDSGLAIGLFNNTLHFKITFYEYILFFLNHFTNNENMNL